jgi:protein gp37
MDTRLVSELIPHPENVKIYNDHADNDLIESVRAKGVINPLLITYDNRIINGHRRQDAAIKANIQRVNVVVFPSHDELDILEALIESNRQRQKTNEQMGREFAALHEIYRKRSEQGKRADLTSADQSAEVKLIPPTQKAAIALGVDRETGRRAAAIVKAIDKLEESGKTREVTQLRQTLNTSVRKAYDRAQEAGYIAQQPRLVEAEVKQGTQEYYTLAQWNDLDADQQAELLKVTRNNRKVFNDQKNDNIEWAKWSWNPVTGCKHDCPYCYARDIANRFYEPKFEPSFWPDRLAAPFNTNVPTIARNEIGYKNVFTCSMADLFGRWVPREWIEAVLEAVSNAPQWNFLFLTKFPIRLSEFDFPDNAWVGTTVDCQARVKNAENAFRKVKAKVKWLSCEPLLEPLEFDDLGMFQWIVLGGSSESTQTPEWKPPRAWINRIEAKAYEVGCKVYEKTNLLERVREYPGYEEPVILLPDSLRYLPSIEVVGR